MKHQSGWLWTWVCRVKPRPALPNHVRSALFWDIIRHRVVIPYRCIRTPCGSIFKGENSKKLKHSIPEVGKIFFFGGGGLCTRVHHQMFKRSTIYWKPTLCLFSGKKHPNVCTLKLRYSQSLRFIGIVTCWNMHLRTNLAEGSNWKMAIEKLRIDYKDQK
jgi:hypothetical protein